jgi:homoserine dehydrogenase
MDSIKVGLLGLGVVGGGTYKVLARNAQEIARRAAWKLFNRIGSNIRNLIFNMGTF